jgi:flagellar basal body-associated protein FliL
VRSAGKLDAMITLLIIILLVLFLLGGFGYSRRGRV